MNKCIFLLAILFVGLKTKAQNVGIGTTLPQIKLHIKGGLLLDSTNGNTPVSGAGTRMMWIPAKAAFRAGIVNDTEWDDANIGLYSIALGNGPKASGFSSTAMGTNTTASDNFSTAMGYSTTASGTTSTAMGNKTIASGNVSTAMGNNTKSKSFGGLSIGLYNDSTNAASSTSSNSLNRIFEIGNGTADNARSNAMTVLQNGNIGIGTTDPVTLLHAKNGAVLFDGSIGSTPVSGAGTRMMWIPEKGAFRAGNVGNTQWDNANIGLNSFASGYSVTANGFSSIAFGVQTTASGYSSTALGNYATASGSYSTAIGYSTTASGNLSIAIGNNTIASGINTTAMGLYTKSKNYGGFVVGTYNDSTNAIDPNNFNNLNRIFEIGNGTAFNFRSNAMTVLQNGNIGIGELNPAVPLNFASSLGNKISLWGIAANHYGMGIQSNLMQFYSASSGDNIAFGYGNSNSFTENVRFKGNGNVGIGTTNPNYMLTVKNDIDLDNSDANAGTTTNALKFGGGNTGEAIGSNRTTATNQWGLDFYTNSVNRMAISLGGNIGIGTTAPTAKLSVNGTANNATGNWGVFSDERVKTVTGNFTDGLNVIRQINPVIFNYNDNAPFKTSDDQIGIVAQELEKIAPYMVSKQAYNQFADLREVNNQAYVFLLINAVKEQQQQIAAEQQANEILKQRLEKLEKLISSLGLK
jgi:hypothetical protein